MRDEADSRSVLLARGTGMGLGIIPRVKCLSQAYLADPGPGCCFDDIWVTGIHGRAPSGPMTWDDGQGCNENTWVNGIKLSSYGERLKTEFFFLQEIIELH